MITDTVVYVLNKLQGAFFSPLIQSNTSVTTSMSPWSGMDRDGDGNRTQHFVHFWQEPRPHCGTTREFSWLKGKGIGRGFLYLASDEVG